MIPLKVKAEADPQFSDEAWQAMQEIEQEYLTPDIALDAFKAEAAGYEKFDTMGQWLANQTLEKLEDRDPELNEDITDYFTAKSRQFYHGELVKDIMEIGEQLLRKYLADDILRTIGDYDQFFRLALQSKDSWEASGQAVQNMLAIFRNDLNRQLLEQGWPEHELEGPIKRRAQDVILARFTEALNQLHSEYIEPQEPEPDPLRSLLTHVPPTQASAIADLLKVGNELDKAGGSDGARQIDEMLFALAQVPGGQVALALQSANAMAQAANGLLNAIQQMRRQNITAITPEALANLQRWNYAMSGQVARMNQILQTAQLAPVPAPR